MIRRLALSLALAILYPSLVSAAIHVGHERTLPPPRLGTASGTQQDVSVASSGEETLVAWIDNTRGRTGAYVAALSPDVRLIEGSQRWLVPGALEVTITWTGSEYLALATTPLGMVASTLDRDRATVVEPRLVLSGVNRVSTVAWVGSSGMLIYGRHDRIEAAILDRQGNVTRAGIAVPGDAVQDARVVTDGTSFFMFWRRREPGPQHLVDAMFVARFAADGTLQQVAPAPLWAEAGLLEPWDAAFDGRRFALVLSQRTGDGKTTMHRIFVDPVTFVDPATLKPTLLAPIDLGTAGAAGVEWNGTQFRAFWFDARTRELRTLAFAEGSPDGAPGTVFEQSAPSIDPEGVWNGRALVVVWTTRDPVNFETDVLAAGLWDGHARTRFTVSLSHGWQSLAGIATNGNESLVVWLDGNVARTDLVRVVSAHATGGVIDQAPRVHSDRVYHGRPVVVFTGTMYLLVFNETIPNSSVARVAFRRIDAGGTPLGTVTHIGYGMGFGAAWNGTHLLVAWDSGDDFSAVRITHDGRIVDSTPLTIATPPTAQAMTVASNGTDFLLVWHEGLDFFRPTPDLMDIYAIPISAAGNVIGGRIDVATGPRNQRFPAVASDGRDYVIAYLHDQTVAAKKVLSIGALANATAQDSGTFIAEDPFTYTRPAIAATPAGFMVAWETRAEIHAGDLWLARLDRDAAVADSPRPVVRSALFEMQPTLTPVNGGAVDLAYSRLSGDSTYGATMRIFIRRVEEVAKRRRAARH